MFQVRSDFRASAAPVLNPVQNESNICDFFTKPFNSQVLISNSPYCLPNSSCDASLENLVLDQLMIFLLRFFLNYLIS